MEAAAKGWLSGRCEAGSFMPGQPQPGEAPKETDAAVIHS